MNKRWLPFYASILVLIIFALYYIFSGNYEFLIYIASIGILIALLMWSDRYVEYSLLGTWGFAIWNLGHMLGGSLMINGKTLYATILIPIIDAPYNVLKYDQLMHAFCYFVFAILMYSVVVYLLRSTGGKRQPKNWLLALIVILAATGIGALNEIIEFGITIFNPSSGVGDYINNAQDLVFNLIGAIIGAWVAVRMSWKN